MIQVDKGWKKEEKENKVIFRPRIQACGNKRKGKKGST